VLPAWRGAAPVQHALWAGDEVTGATTFRIVRELDAGPTYGLMTERVRPGDTAGSLLERLAEGGAGLLVATLDGLEIGSLEAREQPEDGISFAPKITVEDARVDWTEPAMAVDRRIRACTPAPGAWTTYKGERVKLGPVTIADGAVPPGELLVGKNAVAVGTGTGALKLGLVKAFGKKEMPAADWARGIRVEPGARFGD
jgi:methionyl-tRNA formyltransferase